MGSHRGCCGTACRGRSRVVCDLGDGGRRSGLYGDADGGAPNHGRRNDDGLDDLVDAGLLERRVLDTRPPAVEYRLTSQGKRFEPLVRELVRCTR